jgi:hypothetical protein
VERPAVHSVPGGRGAQARVVRVEGEGMEEATGRRPHHFCSLADLDPGSVVLGHREPLRKTWPNPSVWACAAWRPWLLTESYHVLHISNDLKYDVF